METVLAILQLLIPISLCIAGVLCFAGLAGGGGKSELEDQAQYEHFNPRVKPVREVHRKEPTPLQTKHSAVTVDKKPEKVVVPDDLGKTKSVHGLMEKQAYYCFENQSVDEALSSCSKALKIFNRESGSSPSVGALQSKLPILGAIFRQWLLPLVSRS